MYDYDRSKSAAGRKFPMPRGNKFEVTLKGRPRGNTVDILVNGKVVEQTFFNDQSGTMIGSFRGVVYDLRQEHPDVEIKLPGGLKNENEIVRDQRVLLDPNDPVLTKGGM